MSGRYDYEPGREVLHGSVFRLGGHRPRWRSHALGLLAVALSGALGYAVGVIARLACG